MSVWKWDDSLETGMELIDCQHKELIARVNSLMKAIDKRDKDEVVKSMLNYLNEYVLEHFIAEEKLQSEIGYPEYESHKKLHDGFSEELRLLVHKFMSKGITADITFDLGQLLNIWLVEHISIQDRKIADYIKGCEI